MLCVLCVMCEVRLSTPCPDHPAEVPHFRQFVTELMMGWAKTKMAHPQLVKEVYSLLHRQYNGAHEVGCVWGTFLKGVGHM